MPKQKITKEMVVEAAFDLARAGGMEAVTVKAIAGSLQCSVQPIYSYCDNMENLRREVNLRAKQFVGQYVRERLDPRDIFRSTGHAHVQLAREEPHIFRMFILQERENISSLQELYDSETGPQVPQAIARGLGISVEKARELHLHMLIYTIGIGTIFSVTKPGIPAEEIYSQQEKAFVAFLQKTMEDEKNG